MKNITIINMLRANSYTFEKAFDSKSAFDLLLEKKALFEQSDKVVVLCKPGLTEQIKQSCDHEIFSREIEKNSQIFQALAELSAGYDTIFHLWGDGPCLDTGLSLQLLAEHQELVCEYSFADAFPGGTCCEFVATEIVPSLLKLTLTETKTFSYPDRNFIFETIKKDINGFDIHTKVADLDMRNLRLNLFTDTMENFMLTQAICATGITDAARLSSYIMENQSILRQIPAYLQVQIAGGCLQSCSYCPYPKVNPGLLTDKRFMPLEDFSKIVDKIEKVNPEFVISISLWGEPSIHPQIEAVISKVLATPSGRLLIETSGLGWELEAVKRIAELDNGRIFWIVSLDSDDKGLYSVVRGQGYDEAFEFFRNVYELFPENVWAQGVRMTNTEEGLEVFYKNITDQGKKIIIQKYNNFSGLLEDKKVVDLSPSRRYPCWHLKRELAILLDGSVVQCFNDVKGKNVWGNVLNEEIITIFERGKQLYEKQINQEFTDICSCCDEYYTYNF